MVTVLVSDPAGIRQYRANVVDQVRARLHAHRSDRELMAGASPDHSVGLALHAERILQPKSRTDLADALRGIVRMAQSEPKGPAAAKVICRQQVRQAISELLLLADRLDRPGPVSPQSVALARMVLTEGSGPLFRPDGHAYLAEQLQQALRVADSLEPVAAPPAWSHF